MSKLDLFTTALINEAPKFFGAFILLLLAWFGGLRLSVRWNLHQKKKEYDLITARDFHDLYGEFFAIWKLWNYYRKEVAGQSLSAISSGASRWSLLERACNAEAKLESTLVRLACERRLKNDDIPSLGRFRQIYQRLRQSIRDDKPLEWNRSEDPEYVEFKTRATEIAALIAGTGLAREISSKNLIEITSNKYERPRYS
jgi:hypothetical protein